MTDGMVQALFDIFLDRFLEFGRHDGCLLLSEIYQGAVDFCKETIGKDERRRDRNDSRNCGGWSFREDLGYSYRRVGQETMHKTYEHKYII